MVYCWKCGTELRDDASFCLKCGTSVKPTVTTQGQTGFELLTSDKSAQDHWARRVVAFIIDSVIVGAIVSVLVLAAIIPGFILGGGVFPFWWGFWFGGILTLLILAYFILAEAAYSKTLGKNIMGLKIVRKDGKPIDLGTSFLRNISKISLVLLILDVAAGLAIRGDISQKFSDRYAGTVVETTPQPKIIS